MIGSGGSPCASCGRKVQLRQRGPEGGRICGACYARSRLEECVACGLWRTPNRRVADGGVLCHTCARRQDAAAERDALRVGIAEVVRTIEVDLALEVVIEAVARAARDLRQTRWLAEAVAEGSAVLLGGSTGPTVVDRLVAELKAVGAVHVSPPTCCRCGTTRRLRERLDGLRLCTPCGALIKRAERCSRCGKVRPVAFRLPDGTGLCGACRLALNIGQCATCGRVTTINRRGADGGGVCGRCAPPRPLVRCSVCGRTRPGYKARGLCETCGRRMATCGYCGRTSIVVSVWARGPVCSSCHHKLLAAKGTCQGCGDQRRIDPRDPDGRSLCSDCAGLPLLSVCVACGAEDRLYEAGRCFACTLRHRLDDLIGDSPALAGLQDALAESLSPRAAVRWLAKPETRQVLGAMAAGELPVSHEALDGLPATKSLAHLRQVLVSAGVLPDRDEDTTRLEVWMDQQLANVEDDEDRRVLEAFARWWVLRRHRQRISRRGVSSTDHARTKIREAIRLMTWLRSHGRTLTTCTQGDIDLWLVGPPARRHARDFLRWACRQRLAKNLDIVRPPDRVPCRGIDADEQMALARRLLADNDVPLVVRVAGLFLLCYGQPLSRIVRLRREDVHDDGENVSIAFGRTDVVLPPAIAALVRELTASHGRSATGTRRRTEWLFPGGRPGRPLTADGLEQRMHCYGIDARAGRNSLLLDLAAELPPVVLADLIGLYPNTAVRWVQAARGDWTAYAAAKAKR